MFIPSGESLGDMIKRDRDSNHINASVEFNYCLIKKITLLVITCKHCAFSWILAGNSRCYIVLSELMYFNLVIFINLPLTLSLFPALDETNPSISPFRKVMACQFNSIQFNSLFQFTQSNTIFYCFIKLSMSFIV